MKKIVIFAVLFIFILNTVFSQTGESPVPQMDEAVNILARSIHAKLVEKRAEKVSIGNFTFQDGATTFNSFWVNQLVVELVNMPGRTYTVHSGALGDTEWTVSGEIVLVADIIRVYSRMVRTSDRAIEGSFISNFQRNEYINQMLSVSAGGSSSQGGSDMYEPDSWENPTVYTMMPTASGGTQDIPVMNRVITADDEDFFLLIPDADGRLTIETTGSIDTYMYLYDYDTEEELAYDDDGGQSFNARIQFNVRAGTRYMAVVTGYSSSTTGSYGFRAYMTVREGASSFDNPISYEIGIGDENITAVQRTLESGDEDYFLLIPDRDGRLTIETTGRTDTYMLLYDANTEDLLVENDDGGTNYNARITYNVRAGARYIAVVRGYYNSGGGYSFRAFFSSAGALSPDEYEVDDEPALAKTIEIWTPQTRTFHTANDVDWVQFQITQGGRYVIDARGVNSNRLDTYIELFDASLNFIAQDDDSGDSLSSRLGLNLNSGVYYLKVWCLNDDPDQGYVLSILGTRE